MTRSTRFGWSRACILLVAGFWLLVGAVAALAAGCFPVPSATERTAPSSAPFTLQPSPSDVVLATTTTTQDSGLLEVLLPAFEWESGYRVKTIIQGTGAVLALAARGEADVVLSHAPEAEKQWMAQGNGVDRRLVMYNDFIVVGPAADPAGVRSARDAATAFRLIADRGAPFVSRGDQSGTHVRELQLWMRAGLEPKGRPWYVESGSGQGQTLTIADQRGAYALADRGTWLAFRSRLQLGLLFEGDPMLLNIYHVMPVNPDKFANLPINAAGGRAFAEFVLGPRGQAIIGEFGKDRFGQSLFTPAAGKREDELAR